MDKKSDWYKSLEFACEHLARQFPSESLVRELASYLGSVSASDLPRAFRELEAVGQRTAPEDHNFWSYLAGTASQLGLIDLEDEYRQKSDESYIDAAVAMPNSCRGLPTINLFSMTQACLIILMPSGVAYRNQTCGNATGQRAEEGVLVPLVEPAIDEKSMVLECPVFVALASLQWRAVLGIDQKRAEEIDAILQRFYWTRGLAVDRNRLAESEEAWVFLEINPRQFRLAVRLKCTKAVLVWPNSD